MTSKLTSLSKRVRVDDRVGSRHLALPLQNFDIKTRLVRLDYGDVWFEGWQRGKISRIGVELKRVDDLIQSMLSKRLIDRQLPGMAEAYDVRYLLVEGCWRPSDMGGIEILRCRGDWCGWRPARTSLTYSQLNRFLITMAQYGGVAVWRSSGLDETVTMISDLFHWWQKRKHRAHLGFYTPPMYDTNALDPDANRKRLRRMAEHLPHVGWFRGIDIARHFDSIDEMINAPIKRWVRIPDFGAKRALDVRAAIKARIGR